MNDEPRRTTATEPVVVSLAHEPVELYKVLKFAGLANSGGEAKCLIDDGLVQVNGSVETRRRRKIRAQDVIELGEVCVHTQLGSSSAS